MTLPRISVGTFMTGLCVVALDCVVFRSFGARPNGLPRPLLFAVMATLPMANVLAFAIARLLGDRGRGRVRWGLAGFVIGGSVALTTTLLGGRFCLARLETALTGTSLAIWIETILETSPYGQPIVISVIVGLLPFLLQVVVALACSGIGQKLAKAPVSLPTTSARPALRVTIVALLLAAIPAVLVEAHLRTTVDPHLTRLAVGSAATFHIGLFDMYRIPKCSPVIALVGSKVRVEQDDEPNVIEQILTGKSLRIRDRRQVKVTFLDGPRAGESTALPHCYLNANP